MEFPFSQWGPQFTGMPRPVAGRLYLNDKKAYKQTAYCNLVFVWTTKHMYNFMSLSCPEAEQ